MLCREMSSSEFSLINLTTYWALLLTNNRKQFWLTEVKELLKDYEIDKRKTDYSGLGKNKSISHSLFRLTSLRWVFPAGFHAYII